MKGLILKFLSQLLTLMNKLDPNIHGYSLKSLLDLLNILLNILFLVMKSVNFFVHISLLFLNKRYELQKV